jgi:hypothetical protein
MIMISNLRLVSALMSVALAATACSGGDDDGTGTGTGGGAGTGGATGGGSGKGGAGGSSGGTAGSGGSGGASNPALASCMAYCAATHPDPPTGTCMSTSAPQDCADYTCTARAGNPSGNIANAPAACQAAMKAFWDCLSASPDPCEQPGPCETQAAATAVCAE